MAIRHGIEKSFDEEPAGHERRGHVKIEGRICVKRERPKKKKKTWAIILE